MGKRLQRSLTEEVGPDVVSALLAENLVPSVGRSVIMTRAVQASPWRYVGRRAMLTLRETDQPVRRIMATVEDVDSRSGLVTLSPGDNASQIVLWASEVDWPRSWRLGR